MAKPTFAEQCKTKVDAWAKRIYWLPLLVSFLLFIYKLSPFTVKELTFYLFTPSVSIELLPHGFVVDGKEFVFGMSEAEVLALMGEPQEPSIYSLIYPSGVSFAFDSYGDPQATARYLTSLHLFPKNKEGARFSLGRKSRGMARLFHRKGFASITPLPEVARMIAKVKDPPMRIVENYDTLLLALWGDSGLLLVDKDEDAGDFFKEWHMSYLNSTEPEHLRAPLREPVAIELLPHGVRVGESEFPFGMSEAQLIEQWGEADRIRRSENGATYVYSGQFILDFSREKDSDTPLGLDRIVLNTHDTPEAYMVLGESRLAFDRPYLMLVDHLKALRADGRIDANDSMSIFTWQEGALRVVQREGKVTLLIYTDHANDSARLPAPASS